MLNTHVERRDGLVRSGRDVKRAVLRQTCRPPTRNEYTNAFCVLRPSAFCYAVHSTQPYVRRARATPKCGFEWKRRIFAHARDRPLCVRLFKRPHQPDLCAGRAVNGFSSFFSPSAPRGRVRRMTRPGARHVFEGRRWEQSPASPHRPHYSLCTRRIS